MSATAADLTGRWQGMFNYPKGAETTAFSAELIDTAGLLSGRIAEPDLFSRSMASIEAVIDGQRKGSAVRFTKFYDDPTGNYDAVLYTGTLDGTGGEITGRWDIPGAWSGTFIMVRDMPQEVGALHAVGDEIR